MTESNPAPEDIVQVSETDKTRAEEIKNEANIAFKGTNRAIIV